MSPNKPSSEYSKSLFLRINDQEYNPPKLRLNVSAASMEGGSPSAHELVVLQFLDQQQQIATNEKGIAENIEVEFACTHQGVKDKLQVWLQNIDDETQASQVAEYDLVSPVLKESINKTALDLEKTKANMRREIAERDELSRKLREEIKQLNRSLQAAVGDYAGILKELEEERKKNEAREKIQQTPTLSKKEKLLEDLALNFNQGMLFWQEAGLFTEERAKKGFRPPDFERDYLPLLTDEHFALMEEGEKGDIDKGYNVPIWTPMDVPFYSQNPQELNYLKLLETALLKSFYGTAKGKKRRNTLLWGRGKIELEPKIGDKILDISQDKYRYEHGIIDEGYIYKYGDSLANINNLECDIEKQTGGILRLEKNITIEPEDLAKKSISAHDWRGIMRQGIIFSPLVGLQNIKENIAYYLHHLNTNGWIPDAEPLLIPGDDLGVGPRNFLQKWSGGVSKDDKPFIFQIGTCPRKERDSYGVRLGVRVLEGTASLIKDLLLTEKL